MTLEISKALADRIDTAAIEDGFNSRSEFLRFLIVTYLKKEHPNQPRREIEECKSEVKEEEEDVFANVDLEHGIPLHVIEKIKEIAAKKSADL